MFRMHEQTRRACSRFAFLALALAPTIGIIAWVWMWSRTAHRDALLAELSRDLGLRVEAESVEHPWADTVRFRTLASAIRETNEVSPGCRRVKSKRYGVGHSSPHPRSN